MSVVDPGWGLSESEPVSNIFNGTCYSEDFSLNIARIHGNVMNDPTNILIVTLDILLTELPFENHSNKAMLFESRVCCNNLRD